METWMLRLFLQLAVDMQRKENWDLTGMFAYG